MNNVKVSFIVPVYNVEKYLSECLDSLISQTIDSKEIILINDGSTDKSLDICNEYSDRYSIIKVITKKNGGLSSARNVGIDNSTGEYIFFVDSDDFLLGDYTSRIYNECVENELDIIRCIYCIYNDNKKELILRIDDTKQYYNKPLLGLEFLREEIINKTYEVVACLGLFRREYLLKKRLKFTEGVTHEDHEFFLKCLLADSNCKVMKRDLKIYAYRQREASITNTPQLKNIQDILKNVDSMKNYIDELNLSKEEKKIAMKPISAIFYQLTSVYGRLSKQDKKKAYKLVSKKLARDMIKYAFDKHQKIKIVMFFYFRIAVDIIYKIKLG